MSFPLIVFWEIDVRIAVRLLAVTVSFIVGLAAAGGSQVIFAQSESNYKLDNDEPTVQDQSDALELTLPFSVRDDRYRPITSPSVKSAEIHIDDGSGSAYPANVSAPAKPLYLVFLLDMSTSMTSAVGDMRNAVRSAIGKTPDNASIGLFTFSTQIEQISGFSGNKEDVRNALDRVANPAGSTCLYDAVYEAADRLAGEDGRRAILVFTDGKDEKQIGNQYPQCSQHSLAQAVRRAAEAEVRIYAVGMKTSRLNEDAIQDLKILGRETGGADYIGERFALADLFEDAVSGLGSEYRAVANVVVGEGRHHATLWVKLENGVELAEEFSFLSTRNYLPTVVPQQPTAIPATPTPTSIGMRMKLVRGRDEIKVPIVLSNAHLVDRLLTQVEERDGMMVWEKTADVRGRDTFTPTIPYAQLKHEQKYTFRVEAFDADGGRVYILDEEESANSDKPKYRLEVTKEFIHKMPEPASIEAKVEGVISIKDQQVIVVDLDISQPGTIEKYSTHLIDSDTGEKIQDTGLVLFPANSQQIEIPMPDFFLTQGLGELSIDLVVKLYDEDENQIELEPYTFVHHFPERPGRFKRLLTTLGSNLWLSGGILIAMFAIVGWFMGGRNKKKQSPFAASIDYTVAEGEGVKAPLSNQPRLRIQVIQTPNTTERKAYVVTKFPCIIGRSSSCDIAFSGDSRMSRQHAKIALRGDEFFLTDLGSNNGTSIDGNPLGAESTAKLQDYQNVTFGRDTSVEVKIQYQ